LRVEEIVDKGQRLMIRKKSNFPSPGGRGLRGGGYNRLKYLLIHPHPDPLPSREREIFDFLRDHQGSGLK
jgi:hypothetical protein